MNTGRFAMRTGEAPILERADRLWNSSTVAHATRWDLDLPDRDGVFGYLADVLSHQIDRLGGGVDRPACYFYELSIRHEDMHVEALAYTRQTLGYARPQGLGRPAADRAGAWEGDVAVPGGYWQLGSTSADGFVFDNEKWAHDVETAPFHIAKAAVTNAEFAAFVDQGGYRRREFWSAPGWEWRERVAAEHPVYWLHNQGGSWTWRSHDKQEALPPHAPVTFRQLVRGASLLQLGQAAAALRGRMGGRGARRSERGRLALDLASAAGRGARRRRIASAPTSAWPATVRSMSPRAPRRQRVRMPADDR
jgi:hypothetical protein